MKFKKLTFQTNERSNQIVANVRDAGNDLIFLLHGLGCSKDSFHHIWTDANFDAYSILAPDFTGFGESSKSNEFSYTMQAQAQLCTEILIKFSDKRLHIVAHSMGCAVALLLADEILNKTKTFTSAEGNLIDEDCGILSRKIISVSPKVFASDIYPQLRDKFNRLGEGYMDIDSTSADVLYKTAESLVYWSDSGKLLEKFKSLSCRKAYFFGDKNSDLPTVSFVEDVPTVMIKRSGHFLMNDNPKDFYGELYKFLNLRN